MFFYWSDFLHLLLFFLLPSWLSLMNIFQKRKVNPKWNIIGCIPLPGAAEGRTPPALCPTQIHQTLMLLHSCCLTHIFLITSHFWGPQCCCHYPYRNVVRLSTYMVFFQTALLFCKSSEDASGVSQPHQCDTEHGSGTLSSSIDPQIAVFPETSKFSQVVIMVLITW